MGTSADDGPSSIIFDAGLFHQKYYEHQRSEHFDHASEALADFLEHGAASGLSPHPLFSVPFYRRLSPGLGEASGNPLLHYILAGWREGLDPHPLFDGRWYTAQPGDAPPANPLSHYLREGLRSRRSPNPLFDNDLYRRENPDAAQAGVNPLEHYVLYGRDEGRLPHARLGPLLAAWQRPADTLERGTWKRPNAVWIVAAGGEAGTDAAALERMWQELADDGRVDLRIVIDRRGALCARFERLGPTICLEDYGAQTTGDVRPSALRMVVFSLLGGIHAVEIAALCALPAVANALADLGVSVSGPRGVVARRQPAKRVIVPCMDWSTSGVHTAAEALGKELIARKWDFRILFTRGTIGVLDGGNRRDHLPQVPYEFLDVSQYHTRQQQLAAIIRYFEWQAPCVFLAAFDDLANAVAPALSDRVGVVGWLQSDEDHYYESANRLGRYWNRIACVSRRIATQIEERDPALFSKIEQIENATVRRDEVVRHRSLLEGGTVRLVYAGRLVQHQKRVLDFIPLVRALDRLRVAYQLTLIGDGSGALVEETLRRELAGQLVGGKVRLTGRLSRAEVLRELVDHDVFVLLSDFEGFPVAVLEAMACGCIPVVAHVDSGVPELVRHDENGLVIDHRDYQRWAAALQELGADERRMRRLSAAASREVADRHTIDTMADKFEALFSTVLEEIAAGTYHRPAPLTRQNKFGDVLLPSSLQGTLAD
jgi:glycosyltransferase involved in cell wall biosynthesis